MRRLSSAAQCRVATVRSIFAVGFAAQLAGLVNVLGDQAFAVGFHQAGQTVQ